MTAQIKLFLAYVAQTIDMYGWVTRTKAKEAADQGEQGVVATCDLALTFMTTKSAEMAPSEEAIKLGDETYAWLINELVPNAKTDFDRRLTGFFENGKLDNRSIGFIAAAINSYKRTQEDKANAGTSEYVGTEGDKMTLQLLVTQAKETSRGSWMYNFTDAKGNVLQWFANSQQDMEEGCTYKIQGTIKKHEEFRGVKKTLLNRCKVLGQVKEVNA